MKNTIDITPTPAEAARIIRTVFEAAYATPVKSLTASQVLWAWSQIEATEKALGETITDLPKALVEELIRFYIDKAAAVPERFIDESTTYFDLSNS